MEIKVGGTCMYRRERVKIAAKYHDRIDGWILEITNPYSPCWQAGRHSQDVLVKCVPALNPEKYYYWVKSVSGYEPPKKKKVYK